MLAPLLFKAYRHEANVFPSNKTSHKPTLQFSHPSHVWSCQQQQIRGVAAPNSATSTPISKKIKHLPYWEVLLPPRPPDETVPFYISVTKQ
jgi:hypothetical protein